MTVDELIAVLEAATPAQIGRIERLLNRYSDLPTGPRLDRNMRPPGGRDTMPLGERGTRPLPPAFPEPPVVPAEGPDRGRPLIESAG